jgi:hypothetical protein
MPHPEAVRSSYEPRMRRLRWRILTWIGGLIALLFVVVVLEGSGGHDGYLCEWGYDMDDTGDGDTACGH